jgi:3-oxoacyl-[acyl-carrier protein] reductase
MLQGKTALITGGATGIGRAIALRLAREGANVAINYSRSEEDARQTAKEVEALGVQAIIVKASVANDQEVKEMIQETTDRFGRLDIVVNSAGTTNFVAHNDLEGMKEEYWDRVMDVNVKGLFFCCRAAAAELKKQNGCIVNITSVAGFTGQGSSIAYAASKAAAVSVTKSLARVLAPEVRVNGIAPGVVITRWVEGQEDFVERMSKTTPLRRAAYPEDVAETAFALIAHNQFVTGQTIVVDGGTYIP